MFRKLWTLKGRKMAKYKKRAPRKSKSEGKIAHKKTTIDGITFDSKMEAQYYEYLKDLKKQGQIKKIELQPKFELSPKYFIYNGAAITYGSYDWDILDKERKSVNKTACEDDKIKIVQPLRYIADFRITEADNKIRVIDVKGIKTADFKIKEKIYNLFYPEYPLECITWDGPSKQWVSFDEANRLKKERKKKK